MIFRIFKFKNGTIIGDLFSRNDSLARRQAAKKCRLSVDMIDDTKGYSWSGRKTI